MDQLTQAERKTLNKAMDIIIARTAYGASWQIGANFYRDCGPPSHDMTYFSSAKGQHSFCRGDTFADKVEYALAREEEDALSEDEVKALRVASLREQLARLTGEAA